jgi:hypothetical protein
MLARVPFSSAIDPSRMKGRSHYSEVLEIQLARRHIANGEMADASHAMAQAEEIVTEVAKGQAAEDSQN